MAFSNQSATLIHLGFPAIFEADVLDPLRDYFFATLQVQAVRFPNLGYFFSQLSDALFDGLLQEVRLAEQTRDQTVVTSHFTH